MPKSIQAKSSSSPDVEYKIVIEGACQKCSHRNFCENPCFFVKKLLEHKNRALYEYAWSGFGEDHKLIQIVHPKSGLEIRESSLSLPSSLPDEENDKTMENKKQRAFSDLQESPFVGSINTELKQTGIFVDRFFNQWEYKDLAVKYDTSVENCRTIYRKAQERIIEIVGADKRIKLAKENSSRIVNMKSGLKCFLLYTVFGLTTSEICKILGIALSARSNVHREIRKTRDRIICGELSLLDISEEEKEAADARLEKIRAKKRKKADIYRAKKKIEQQNA